VKKWIYLIKEETDYGELSYKIGITKRDANQRLKEHQTGNSNKLEIIALFASYYSGMLETTLHRIYSTEGKRGEWFYLSQDQVETFLLNCQKVEDNFKIINENKDDI